MKIIVAVDGTPSSEAAFDALDKIKWDEGTEIKLVSVVAPVENSLTFGAMRENAAKYQQDMKEAATEALKGMAQELQKDLTKCDVTYEVGMGEAKSQILEITTLWPANLVIMGSRGRKALESMFLGSVSQGVVLQSPCPVIVAKSEAEDPEHSFKNILISVDNSPYSRASLDWLMSINWGDSSQFKVVTIVPPLIDAYDSVVSGASSSSLSIQHQKQMDSANAELEKLVAELTDHFGKGRVSMQVAQGDPRETIISVATSSSADLIVMGSHGRTGLNRLMLGSVSQAVAMHAPCSVAIVRGLVAGGQTRMQATGLFKVLPEKS